MPERLMDVWKRLVGEIAPKELAVANVGGVEVICDIHDVPKLMGEKP